MFLLPKFVMVIVEIMAIFDHVKFLMDCEQIHTFLPFVNDTETSLNR